MSYIYRYKHAGRSGHVHDFTCSISCRPHILSRYRCDALGSSQSSTAWHDPAMIMSTGDHRGKVMLKPIYEKLGPYKASALINWHALTGCDTTGHIQGKWRKDALKLSLRQIPLYSMHWRGLDKVQNHHLKWSKDVKSSCVHYLN